MLPEINVKLWITGEILDFEELSAFIGINPIKTFVRKFDTNNIRDVPKFRWLIETGYSECDSTDDKAQELFA